MIRPLSLASLLLVLFLATAVAAQEAPRLLSGDSPSAVIGGSPAPGKAARDTFYLLGGPDRQDGRFEDQFGTPTWQGWTHEDVTDDPTLYWQVSDFQALAGQYSMWCGTVLPGGDHGYGNGWYQNLVFTEQLDDPQIAHTITWIATVRVDLEPGYDYLYLQVNRGGSWETLQSFDGEAVHQIDEVIAMEPGDYVGEGGDEVQLRFRVVTDGVWSDEDGLWDTDGACQLDDIEVSVEGVSVDLEDFEDQTSERWLPGFDAAVGDFSHIWPYLEDLDPCRSNWTPQVVFIDDGQVVPGTGGTMCITWCYGPNGYIVNNSGGLAGPEHHLDNMVISPVLEWPAGAGAAYLQFEAFDHESLFPGTAGMFYRWHVRSVSTGDPADLEDAAWGGNNLLYYGGPHYVIRREVLTGLLEPGVTHLQVALRVSELGYLWTDDWDGDDGTPAPYFDNVQVVAYEASGPEVTAEEIHLFNDGFPASGELDLTDLGSNSVRLDMAASISPDDHLRNDPGDSVVFDAATIRAGAVLEDRPRVHVRLAANRLFRDVRALPPGFVLQQNGLFRHDLVTGSVLADSVFAASGGYVRDRWSVDLPDTGFFFPGDIIHYFVEAQDVVGGQVGTTLLPADTTGFAGFAVIDDYDERFTVRALPSVHSDAGDQPPVLLWDDHGDPEAREMWRTSLRQNHLAEGIYYDLFVTNGPTSGVGNGLGGRATVEQLAGYEILLYTSGDLYNFLISDGNVQHGPGDDLGLLTGWLNLGDRGLLLSGDSVASYLDRDGGTDGHQFLAEHVGVEVVDSHLRPLIANQTAPLVRTISGNGAIYSIDEWIAYGGCLDVNRFDAVEATMGTVRLAEYTDPAGNQGVYTYAAATAREHATTQSRVVLLPHDFSFVFTAPGWIPPPGHAGHPARTVLLENLIDYFGVIIIPPPGVAPEARLQVSQYPNPFNPRTTIALNLPRAGQVSLKIFDIRGAVVRTLVDERLPAGPHEIVWDGTDARGAAVASGVYFSEVRAAGEVRVQKLALVR